MADKVNWARWLEGQWYTYTPWHVLLWPISVVFRALVALRRTFYHLGYFRIERLPVPVIVVGNITVGGAGKTPTVLWLVDYLKQLGRKPGIISRGYGSNAFHPRLVTALSNPEVVGDEPLLLARRSGCPVWVGHDRVATAQELLHTHPECDVLVSDDGLQHYRLKRDMEVVVMEYLRRFGNGFMLPAGPLREPAGRLKSVDAVVVNGAAWLEGPNQFAMTLKGSTFRNLENPERYAPAEEFKGRRVHALAGIGNPRRFFDHLRGLGLEVMEHPFPDHHVFTAKDLEFPGAEAVVMTEKDAVKCAPLATPLCWMLPVEADIDPALGYKVLDTLRRYDGRQTA